MIEIDNVDKHYGNLQVLSAVSMQFQDGEVTAILGPSGAGKSTLIRCINCLESISQGDIRVDGMSVLDKRRTAEIQKRTSMVFQHFNLYPHLTALGNITLAPTKVLRQSRSQAEAKAMELLKMVGLENKAKRYPAELSGGEQQRVGICRALAMNPRHLLLDEVTSAIDPEMTAEVLRVIEDLAGQGTTMILVTHEIEFARRVADRVAFMERGSLVAHQDADTFFNRQSDERIARFIDKMKH
ncbi:MAG: amino acid ABC transporter ATP-binding protein [Devosia sp.]|jgi:ABC-type polar amino acid transport system ATPase subunit|uniref:amino acid ABC transporter ATP-binding protein n=1 Tax=Devosia sp. TaxID=1871048 RepID=UPI001A59684F|nr:amino acid ABC transporter ATP-binding protein [Devosia sp.]MBL8596736.1 amino acid ABC transporter ATP-binding protein [Devosia sp.]